MSSTSSTTPKPTFNYGEMSIETLRGILSVTSSEHPEAALIGKELQERYRHDATGLRSLFDRSYTASNVVLENIQTEAEDMLAQDDHDRENMTSTGMFFVCLDDDIREIYEEVLRLVTMEIDARTIENSPRDSLELMRAAAATPSVEEEAQEEEHLCAKCHQRVWDDPSGNCYGCAFEAEYAAEEAERKKLIAEGKCPDCHRETSLYADRFGECMGCKDDCIEAAEKEKEREERDFYYVLGMRHSRRTGEPC